MRKNYLVLSTLCIFLVHFPIFGYTASQKIEDQITEYILSVLDYAKVPGLSLVMINSGNQTFLNFGLKESNGKQKVDEETLYQIDECSNAFIALAIAKLQEQNLLSLQDNVSKYLPWILTTHGGSKVDVSLKNLLYQTSGFSEGVTLNDVEERFLSNAKTQIQAISLKSNPGERYQFAPVNYSILAMIVEIVSQVSVGDYLENEIFHEIGLEQTSFGKPTDSTLVARGHKIGFFRPLLYDVPIDKINNVAMFSNTEDLVIWLKLHLALLESKRLQVAPAMHVRDETVFPYDLTSYAGGWKVSLRGDGEIYHAGSSPNFSSFIGFVPNRKIGVAVLANSNSTYTKVIGANVLKILAGRDKVEVNVTEGGNDKLYVFISGILLVYVLITSFFLLRLNVQIVRKQRIFHIPSVLELGKLSLSAILLILGGYFFSSIKYSVFETTWRNLIMWSPASLSVLLWLVLVSIGISYLVLLLGALFPEKNKYLRVLPRVLLVSILVGLSNVLLISLVTHAIERKGDLQFFMFSFVGIVLIYIFAQLYVRVSLIKMALTMAFELRIKIFDKIFSASYEDFEKIDRGRIYTVLNGDVAQISQSANHGIQLAISSFTIIIAFLYLGSIASWATILIIVIVFFLAAIYYFVDSRTNKYFEEARSSRTSFMGLINGLIDGYKEISLRARKKEEYRQVLSDNANEFRSKMSTASTRYSYADIVGEALLMFVLGFVVLLLPKLAPSIGSGELMSFVIVILFLMAPIGSVLHSIPAIAQLRIAWVRVRHFLDDLPPKVALEEKSGNRDYNHIDKFEVRNMNYRYENDQEFESFGIGPIDLEFKGGEIVFITGGNGSGKTTFAKVLTGLYRSKEAVFLVDDKEVIFSDLSEFFSVIFNPPYLFERLYGTNGDGAKELRHYLDLLQLDGKVEVINNSFSTLDLSSGQRKRLALLQCYLEDSPIYLFDEWASDQDPQFRNFFYRTLLKEMKLSGKIVIAITHDDHYFDVADKVLKFDSGKLSTV